MVLVTGGNGLIGSFIIRQLLSEGQRVQALVRSNSDLSLLQDILPQIELKEGDVLDLPLLISLFKEVKYVIHTAAIVSFSPKDEQQMLKINVEGTANVVEACLNTNVDKLAYISSIAALGRKKESTIIDENTKWESSDLNSAYARTKYLAELEVWRGTEEGLNAVIVNPSVVLGPGDWNKSSVQLFKYIWQQKPFYTSGHINYVDVRDVAIVTSKLLFSTIKNERYVLNAGYTSYKQLFDLIAVRFGRTKPTIHVSPFFTSLVWRIESIRSFFTGSNPIITKETAQIAKKSYQYDNTKIIKETGHNFIPLEATIYWTCNELINKYKLQPNE